MNAEQQIPIPADSFFDLSKGLSRRIPEMSQFLKRTTIKDLDLGVLFDGYFSDLTEGVDREEAKRRFTSLLEMNLRTYTQEGVGDKDIAEYGTRVVREEGVIKFPNTCYEDALNDQRRESYQIYHDQAILRHFDIELNTWDKLWRETIAPFEDLIGEENQRYIIQRLRDLGFVEKSCELNHSLHALFPALAAETTVPIYELPDKFIMVSPRFFAHHRGQTSIARLTRFVYIPLLNEFAFLERGLFTAYKNEQITEFFTLDGNPKPKFHSSEEILSHVAVLASEFNNLPPHAVFNLIIEKLGVFPKIPLHKNVVLDKERSFVSQLEYVDRILEFETELCTQHPDLITSRSRRLDQSTKVIMHSLLRANELEVEKHVNNYLQIFGDIGYAQNPKNATKLFNQLTLVSYPDFATRVVSLIDCGTGTALGGIKMGENTFSSIVGSLYGEKGMVLLNKYAKKGGDRPKNLDEVREICQVFHKDPNKYTTWRECGMCKQTTYVWGKENKGCDVCPMCEVWDDIDHYQAPDTDQGVSWAKTPDGDPVRVQLTASMGISDFLSSCVTPAIMSGYYQKSTDMSSLVQTTTRIT